MRYNHFSLTEFSCRCDCNTGKINPLLVALLDKIRAHVEMPIRVNSGIRCSSYNDRVNGHIRSRHIPDSQGIAHAADIWCEDLESGQRQL